MPLITGIETQKRRKDRYSVYVDGKFRLSLSQNQLVDAALRAGDSVEEDQLERLQSDSEFGKALDRAYNYCSYRMRSRHEVATYLQKKHYDPELSEQILGRLAEHKVIDDERFAADWVENRLALEHRSLRQLQAELREKHIPSDLIDATLAARPIDEVETLIQLIETKRLAYRYSNERKLMQHLAGKGFRFDTIKAALERLASSEDAVGQPKGDHPQN